ncbi:ABC-F family ATP-binding cassette domain-containing protein [Camelliibacillus cellulosilyticus]|uniref:ABC-F family ATP-binding cassette domain-containing protein n=1 Tax=Camelliibacillus cellulosilyticus TaxID=2174486 RepID=A0ABV9GUG0_9BACL
MILLQTNKITKSFGTDLILSNINIEVQSRERVALVGRNGSGKSTLLKILTSHLSADSGDVIIGKGVSIGYLEQNNALNTANTIYSELLGVFAALIEMEQELRSLEARMAESSDGLSERLLKTYDALQTAYTNGGGYTYQADIQSVLHGLGFGDHDPETPVAKLSSGQKTRLALGKLLLKKPDLLILDEPTNHLDIDTLSWLENYLLHYPGALLVVSHDRYFLDRLVDKVFEISRGVSHKYHGNYSDYIHQKAEEYERYLKQYEKQQKEVADLQDFIRRNIARASTTKRAQSRRKRLEKMALMARPNHGEKSALMTFNIHKQSGRDVLAVHDLVIGYHHKPTVTAAMNLHIQRGDFVALVGPNGIGKTTLIKTLADHLPKLDGAINIGANVSIGYYDQEQSGLMPNKTVLNELWDDFPAFDEHIIRTALGSFLFTGDDVLKVVSDLSGGEKARLSLAKLMMRRDNFLILDEPTNHLDLDSKEVLEAALMEFPGTLLFVSHDRYFINRIATRILELTDDGINEYLGDYDYYVDKKAEKAEIERLEQNAAIKEDSTQTASLGKTSFEQEKANKQTRRRRERRIEELERDIETLEQAIQEKERRLLDPAIYSDHEKAQEINESLSIEKAKRDVLIEEWTNLQS